MKNSKFILCAVLASVLMLIGSAHAEELLKNGSFELNGLASGSTDWDAHHQVDDWGWSGGSVKDHWEAGAEALWTYPIDGDYLVEAGIWKQTTGHVIAEGDEFVISGWTSVPGYNGGRSMVLEPHFWAPGGTVSPAEWTLTVSTPARGNWAYGELSFTIPAGHAGIGKYMGVFITKDLSMGNVAVDDVSLFLQRTKPVSPANGAVNILRDADLEWTVSPSDWAVDVYLDTDPSKMVGAEPNAVKVIDNQVETVYNPPALLDYDTTYYWRADAIEPNLVSPFVGTTYPGAVWSFTTASATPVVGPLGDVFVFAGQTAEFTVTAADPSGTGLTYQWFDSADQPIASAITDTLPVNNVQLGDEGESYYCEVTNSAGTVASNAAIIVVKRAFGIWTLDSSRYVGGQYADDSGEDNHADPNAFPPVWADGAEETPTTNGSLVVGNTWANAGTFNPSAVSNALTLSAWFNWDGNGDLTDPNGTGGILVKRNAWGPVNSAWQLTMEFNGTLKLSVDGDNKIEVFGPMPVGTWTHVCMTVDSDKTAKAYLNGRLVETVADFNFGAATGAPVSVGSVGNDFGAGDSGNKYAFEGKLDDARIYNYALNSYEVGTLYTDFKPSDSFCAEPLAFDIIDDCQVNLLDFAELALHWLDCNMVPASACN